MTLFWDRDNKPIEDTIEWAMKYEDVAYRIIAVDADGPNLPMVSTIWEGLDLAHSLHVTDETAMIFETALLDRGNIVDRWFAHSEDDAREQHRQVCLEHLGREPRPEDGHVQTIIDREKGNE